MKGQPRPRQVVAGVDELDDVLLDGVPLLDLVVTAPIRLVGVVGLAVANSESSPASSSASSVGIGWLEPRDFFIQDFSGFGP
jgi:hypothetical protein